MNGDLAGVIWVAVSLLFVAIAYIDNARRPWGSEVGIVWLVCWMWPLMIIIGPWFWLVDNVLYPVWYDWREKVKVKKHAKKRAKIAAEYGDSSLELWRWESFGIIPTKEHA